MKNQFTMMAVTWVILLSLVTVTTLAPASAVTLDPDLGDEQLSPDNHFRIYYTNNCTDHPLKCVTDATATTLGGDLAHIYTTYTDPGGDFQFNDPTRGTTMPVLIHPCDALGRAWTDGWIELAPIIFGDPLTSRKTPLHEVLHQVQWTYGWRWSGFVLEGTARMMQDKMYDDLDQSWGTEMGAYFDEANLFLDISTDNTLIDQSYPAGLFWTYFTEQYGAVTTEPQVGVDAVRAVFEHYDDGSDDIQRINSALGDLRLGTTFQDVFMDFIVANYAKDLTGTSVPTRYQYIDDDRQPGAYNRPALTLNRDMAAGDVFSATDELRAWSAKYYEARPSADVPIVSVEFHQPDASAVTLVYNLLVIKDDDLVMDVCEFNVMGRDFVRSIVNRDYDRVVVVVGALDHPAAFRYTASTGGGIPTLNILWPQAGNRAQVDADDLNTFHVHLEVVGPGGAVMSGLEPDDFDVTVDGTDFGVITGHEVMGQYWLVVQPEDLGIGIYDLQVSLSAGTISDTERNAVNFSDMVNADTVIVVDRSGSMLEPEWNSQYWEEPDPTDKIYGAIDAAKLYVNSFREGDKIGLVWFSNDADTSKTLRNFNEANRADFIREIDTFDEDESGAWGATSIGDGLWNAQDELDNSGASDHDWAIILLSDGKENQDELIADVVCDGCKIDYCDWDDCDPDKVKTTIHAVALGSDADREKLEDIADKTGGRFEYAIEPRSGDLPNDLADIYRLFAETILLEQRIAAIRGEYGLEPPYPTHTINMESGATEATFVANYNWRAFAWGGQPLVTLRDPGGKSVKPTYVENTHHLFRIPLPESGAWTVELRPPSGTEFWGGYYLIEASVKSKATLEVFLGIPPEECVIGAYLPVIAFLTDTQPITGATISMEITTPELEHAVAVFPSEVDTLRLYDDGAHGDSKADDGVYVGTFRNTDRAGIYNMKVKADGYSSLAGSFKRETKLAFNMRGDEDSDGDGLPDRWERNHGLDPHDGTGDQGAEGDPDMDGLMNKREYDVGTDPMDPDTDDGGENDGSEVRNGRDPHNPGDDALRPPTSLRAIPGVNSVNLTIGYLPEHTSLIVSRAKSPDGPWESFGIRPPVGEYKDCDLENGVTYYYKVVGADMQIYTTHIASRVSAPTRIVSATPKADPIPPSGYVVINNGAELTETEDVTLMIRADPDTTEIMVANDPELADAAWEPYDTAKNWTLLPGSGLRTVYVLFRDAAGNIGPRSPYDPSVDIHPAMDSIILREIATTERQIYFSTEEDFVTQGPKPHDGNPIISDGDLLCSDGTIIARNRELLKAFETEFDLGLDASDVIAIDAKEPLVAFSTELNDPDEQFTAGDLLTTTGTVIPNIALLAMFDIPKIDLGLDAVHFTGDYGGIIKFLEYIADEDAYVWREDPERLSKVLEEYDIDIWFSTEGTAPKPEDPLFLDGDVLSARYGTIVARNSELLPASVPAGIPDRGVDFGLDAATTDRTGNTRVIRFSTEILYEGELDFTDGDVLRIDNGVVCTNNDLIAGFEPKTGFLGLDAISIAVEGCEPGTSVKKVVWDDAEQVWADEITAYVGDTVTFKCAIYNDGCYSLYDITARDVLPDILKYAGGATVNEESCEPHVVEDTKLEWFFEGPLDPSETITIGYDAYVVEHGEGANIHTVEAICEETGEVVNGEGGAYISTVPHTEAPDLVITGIEGVGIIGKPLNIAYTIENQGNAIAGASYTGLYIDGEYVIKDHVDSLEPGGVIEGSFDYLWECEAGEEAEIEVCADIADQVTENDESNNCITEIWTCGTPPLTGLDIYFADAKESPGSVYHYNADTGTEDIIYTRPSKRLYSFAFHPEIPEKLYYVNANEYKIYRTHQISMGWAPEKVVYTHDTYVRDIAFTFDSGGELGLYFSEATGAGGDGKIYRIERDNTASLYYTVKLADVDGSWAGDFAFDAENNLYLSSGNRVPARIYKVDDGSVEEIYKDDKEPIKGLVCEDGVLYYANWRTKIYRLDPDTGERTVVYSNPERGWLSDVGLSKAVPYVPAGNIIYHESHGAGIWRMNPDGSGNTQLSDHGWFAEYSPDNTKIAFGEYYNDGIWVIAADGTNQKQLTKSGSAPTWSPDGKKIAYHKGDTAGASRSIWVIAADGTNAHQLSDNPGSFPKWSPDGTRIAYHGEVNNGIWLINPDGTGETLLHKSGGYPAWSPDGKKIAYASLTDWRIWTIAADGTGATKLTDISGIQPTWSPDGAKVSYEDLANNEGIRVVNADGTDDHLINKVGHAPDWSEGSSVLPEMPNLAYIYSADAASAESYKSLLDVNEYPTTLIPMSNVANTDFSEYGAIIVGSDTSSGYEWGDSASVGAIKNSEKRIIGLGFGGSGLFQELGLSINWGHGWIGQEDSIYVVDSSHTIFNSPNPIVMPADGIVSLYSSSGHIGEYAPSLSADVVLLGREPDNADHYPIVQEEQNILWGFTASPDDMTQVGQDIFINVVDYMTLNIV